MPPVQLRFSTSKTEILFAGSNDKALHRNHREPTKFVGSVVKRAPKVFKTMAFGARFKLAGPLFEILLGCRLFPRSCCRVLDARDATDLGLASSHVVQLPETSFKWALLLHLPPETCPCRDLLATKQVKARHWLSLLNTLL